MYKFYFNNTTYIVIDVLKSLYLSNDTKFKFTFYDSMIEKFSLILNSIEDITYFLCRLRYFIDRLSIDPYDDNYLFSTNPNEYGDTVEILAHYIDNNIDGPTDEDDNIQLYISKINDMNHKYSVIFTINTTAIILDNFSEYIMNILESININILPRAEVIFTNFMYGDFLR